MSIDQCGKREMKNNSVGKKDDDRGPQRRADKKLDFLLDTIDTEVANLAEAVETEGPILAESSSDDEGSAMGLNHDTTAMEDLDLAMVMSGDSDETPSDLGPVAEEMEATIDALKSADAEVEAMLRLEGEARAGKDDDVAASENNAEDQNAADAMVELLATREVDASSLFNLTEEQEEASAEALAVDDILPEDLFCDLDTTSSASEDDAIPESESSMSAEKSSEAFLAELGLETEIEEEQVEVDEESTSPPSSDGDLADLMSSKIEAVLTRLVEERLPAMAERIIIEKLNKMIASLK
jgi:hypothetical protein